MTEEKPLSKQSIILILYLFAIGVFAGSFLQLVTGFYWSIVGSATIVFGITIYGTLKDWTFNIELVDKATIANRKPEGKE